jgi:nucleotide-binding universal stress UspA family protein
MRAGDDGRPVVVGYDGSKTSEHALRWGVEEARMRFDPLLVCHGWQRPRSPIPISQESTEIIRRMSRHVLEMGVSLAHDLAPRVRIRGELVEGSPAAVLVSGSVAAELVAIGPRGWGGVEKSRIGPTAVQLLSHARSPVAVVKETTHPRANRVAVGVEGVNPGSAELAVAFEEARLRRASLLAICLCPGDMEDIRPLVVRFNANVAVWEEKYSGVDVETIVETRPHAEVLRHAADRSDLVVISDKERDDPVDLPLGPVCHSLLREAGCPVIVVPSRILSLSPW